MANRNAFSGIIAVIICIAAGVAGYFGILSGNVQGTVSSKSRIIKAGSAAEFSFIPSQATNYLLVSWIVEPSDGTALECPTNINGNLYAKVVFTIPGKYMVTADIRDKANKAWTIAGFPIQVK